MRFREFLAILAVCAALVACTESRGPVGPTIVPTPTAAPTENSFTLTSITPVIGSILLLGDSIRVDGEFSRATESLWVGYAAVREDGETHIDTIAGGRGTLFGPLGSGFGLDLRNGFYIFAKGHVVDVLFVIGGEDMLGHSGHLNYEAVIFQKRIPTQYRVQ